MTNRRTDNYFLNDLYTIDSIGAAGNSLTASVMFNPSHWIYSCHFPGNPITPGVCVVQVARELVSTHLNKALHIRMLKSIKFLNIINPETDGPIRFLFTLHEENDNTIRAEVNVENSTTVVVKMNIILCQER
ncbi:MAG TPA: hypothetical protein PLP11_08775 [Bacteroidales bacterium]|nr:hypothetical protein [Bacteroidales bacterium]HQP04685.1 hypothetical protein [Bacteroidales bacterium]